MAHETVIHKGIRIPIFPDLMSPKIVCVLQAGTYEQGEAENLGRIIEEGEVILEVGAGIGFISTVAALNPKTSRVEVFEANPDFKQLIETVHRINQVDKVTVNTGVLMHGSPTNTVPFYIRPDFWASSLAPGGGDPPRHVDVPVFDLNATLRRIRPTMIICDIEGGELDLFEHADLTGVTRVMVEIHQNVLGRQKVRRLFDIFSDKGFAYDQDYSHGGVILFTRVDRNLRRRRVKPTETEKENPELKPAVGIVLPPKTFVGRISGLLGLSPLAARYHVLLGAHECGTPFIRRQLMEQKESLAEAGILVPECGRQRGVPGTSDAKQNAGATTADKKTQAARAADAAKARLPDLSSPELQQADRIIICDENLLGTLPALPSNKPHRHVRHRLQSVHKALAGNAKAFYGVTGTADYFASIYWKVLTLKGYQPFDEFVEQTSALEFSWLPICQEIAGVFGPKNIVFFEMDTLVSDSSAVVSRILGAPVNVKAFPTPFQPAAEAVQYIRIEHEWKSSREPVEVARMAKLRYPVDEGYLAFDPWTPEQRELLRKNYLADLAQLGLWHPGEGK